jgi:hypothetical protein
VGGRSSFGFLFGLSLDLGQDGARVHAPSVEVALEGEKVFAVVLLQGVGSARGGPDAQLGSNVLPCFVFCSLEIWENKNNNFFSIRLCLGNWQYFLKKIKNVFTVFFCVHMKTKFLKHNSYNIKTSLGEST